MNTIQKYDFVDPLPGRSFWGFSILIILLTTLGFRLNEAAGLRQGAESGWQGEKGGVFAGQRHPSVGKRIGEGGTRKKKKELLQASLR